MTIHKFDYCLKGSFFRLPIKDLKFADFAIITFKGQGNQLTCSRNASHRKSDSHKVNSKLQLHKALRHETKCLLNWCIVVPSVEFGTYSWWHFSFLLNVLKIRKNIPPKCIIDLFGWNFIMILGNFTESYCMSSHRGSTRIKQIITTVSIEPIIFLKRN